eukprot:SAG31_NODE_18794_length_622_cov_1.170172_1_plen_207_part_11
MYVVPALTQPYVAVTGQPMLGVIEADPSSDLAIRYRHFVRCSVIPSLRKVAAILEAHRYCCLRAEFFTPSILVATLIPILTVPHVLICSAIIELPDKKWLEEKFPKELWYATREDAYIWVWLATVHDWERLTKHWDIGDYTFHQPQNNAALPPLGGLITVLNWSQERGRAKQQELIGMTKADEQAVFDNWDTLSQVLARPGDAARDA